ncbi:MAG: tetratricopeptide repeat protein, partial [Desulfomonilaceae bacterium]
VGNDFVDWDDYSFVTANYHIQSISLDSLRWMLTTFYQGAWHPLTWLSHAVDRSLWGLNPAPHRLINIILHTLNVLLFYSLSIGLQDAWVERNPQRETISSESRFVAAWTAALFFGIHPLRVESVAWIAERKDVLSAFFYLATIITYLGYARVACAEQDKKWRYLLSVGAYLPAVLSKPMAVTLPFVLILIDYFPLYRLNKSNIGMRIWEKSPFFVLAAVAVGMNIAAKWGEAIPFSYVPAGLRIMNGFHAMVFYVQKSVLPSHLLPLYQLDRGIDYFGPTFVFSAMAIIGVTGICIRQAIKNHRVWAAIWFYYVITLVPALGLFLPYRHAMADRYSYLSTLGFWLLAGLGVARLWNAAGRSRHVMVLRVGFVGAMLAVAIGYDYATQNQIGVWKNSETLWSYVIKQSDPVPDMAYFAIGKELERKGDLAEAMANYKRALSLSLENNRFKGRMGAILAKQGDYASALSIYRGILEAEPSNPATFVDIGRVLAMMGRYDEATQSFERALELDPDYLPAFPMLMVAYLEKNQIVRARKFYQKFIEKGFTVDPDIEERLGVLTDVRADYR